MTHSKRRAVTAPSHLKKETIGDLPADDIRYIDPANILKDEYDGLHVRIDQYLKPETKDFNYSTGRVAIMLVMLEGGETGFVADFRELDSGERFQQAASIESPADTEEFNDWQIAKSKERAILAIASKKDNVEQFDGDPDFFEALRSLVDQSDKQLSIIQVQENYRRLRPITPYSFSFYDRIVTIPSVKVKTFFSNL